MNISKVRSTVELDIRETLVSVFESIGIGDVRNVGMKDVINRNLTLIIFPIIFFVL